MATVMDKEWSSGCCSCLDVVPLCIVTWCCPCYTYGQNVDKFKGTGSTGPCMSYCFIGICCGCPCLVAPTFRTELRQKYGLKAAPMDDCLMHFPCCSACALCQESREIAKHATTV